jgi:hypothetical protein
MQHVVKLLFLAAGLCAANSEASTTLYFRLFGSSCFSTTAGVQTNVNRWGVYNTSTTKAMEVSCPIQAPSQKYTEQYIGVGAYNRNASDPFSCTLNMSNDDGYGLTSAVATIANTGDNVQYKSRYNFPAAGNYNPWITCHIPAVYNGSYSYLTSLYVTLTY